MTVAEHQFKGDSFVIDSTEPAVNGPGTPSDGTMAPGDPARPLLAPKPVQAAGGEVARPGADANGALKELRESGVSIWLDMLSRELLQTGQLANLIDEYGVTGATSNPTIFAQAITGSDLYDDQLHRLLDAGQTDLRELFVALALDDVGDAARMLRPAFDASQGRDGFVSFECTPDLADDAEATVEQATDLWERLNLPNVMIKVPGTAAGLSAIEELIHRGVNINVTLLFSVERYGQVIEAYLRGLEKRVDEGLPLGGISSVASFFLSRIDTVVDRKLPGNSQLRGQVALASARAAYGRYRALFSGARWQRLEQLGARVQRPLWASTGTKNPSYSDVMYVAELAGADVINTMPEHTLHAFADHGQIRRRLDAGWADAEAVLSAAARAGIDLTAVTADLERAGVASFCDSYSELLACIETKLEAAHSRERGA